MNKELNRDILMIKLYLYGYNKAEKLELTCINSFTKGCYNDMSAITNSMKYQYINDVVEASVHKIKLVKRIMHGRCSFDGGKVGINIIIT